jgi:hypothetical protein
MNLAAEDDELAVDAGPLDDALTPLAIGSRFA